MLPFFNRNAFFLECADYFSTKESGLWYEVLFGAAKTGELSQSEVDILVFWYSQGIRFAGNSEDWAVSDFNNIITVLQQYRSVFNNGVKKLGLGSRYVYFVKHNGMVYNGISVQGLFVPRRKGNVYLNIEGVASVNKKNDVILFSQTGSYELYHIAHEIGHLFDYNNVNKGFHFTSQGWRDWQNISGWKKVNGNWTCPKGEPGCAGAPSEYALRDPKDDFADSFLFYLFRNSVPIRKPNPISKQRKLDFSGERARFLSRFGK